jgi:Transposase DDE domain
MKLKSRSQCQKTQYKVRNWRSYNQALKSRGSITVWFSPDALERWYYEGPPQKGAQFVYSDEAIEIALTVRKIFQLPFRQTQGFMESLIVLMQVCLGIPDYTVICRRQGALKVKMGRIAKGQRVHIALDSTGLKVYGEGEWKVRQHGWGKHRTWQKMHIAIDPETTEALAVELTTNSVDDGEMAEPLLNQIPDKIQTVRGDGGYDKFKVYDPLARRNIRPIIPPQKNAKIRLHGNSKEPPLPRDEAIRSIRKIGRRKWKEQSGYHLRSKVETFMFRYKTAFGESLMARKLINQVTEVRIGCKILNTCLKLGRPVSEKIKTKD